MLSERRKPDKDALLQHNSALFQRKELAALLGTVAAEWSLTESILAVAFSILLNIDPVIGTAIIDSMHVVNQKKIFIAKVAEEKITDTKLRKRFLDLLDEAVATAKTRGRLVHGRWAISPTYPGDLVWSPKTWLIAAESEVWEEHHFRELISDIQSEREKLHAILIEIGQHLGQLTITENLLRKGTP